MKKQTNEKGFTIIEVVLVLAIAGLIFLIVFLALPQLQRSRRDTQRQNDVGRMVAALESRAGNNDGNYPDNQTELDTFVATYITPDEYRDPSSGNVYTPVYTLGDGSWVGSADVGDVAYREQASCNGDTAQNEPGQSRMVAVVMKLEQAQYCQDNR